MITDCDSIEQLVEAAKSAAGFVLQESGRLKLSPVAVAAMTLAAITVAEAIRDGFPPVDSDVALVDQFNRTMKGII